MDTSSTPTTIFITNDATCPLAGKEQYRWNKTNQTCVSILHQIMNGALIHKRMNDIRVHGDGGGDHNQACLFVLPPCHPFTLHHGNHQKIHTEKNVCFFPFVYGQRGKGKFGVKGVSLSDGQNGTERGQLAKHHPCPSPAYENGNMHADQAKWVQFVVHFCRLLTIPIHQKLTTIESVESLVERAKSKKNSCLVETAVWPWPPVARLSIIHIQQFVCTFLLSSLLFQLWIEYDHRAHTLSRTNKAIIVISGNGLKRLIKRRFSRFLSSSLPCLYRIFAFFSC